MGVDFRDFQGHFQPIVTTSGLVLAHSAKGSSWEDHKYIKRIDGTYYYPKNYEGGRHIDDKKDSVNSEDMEKLLDGIKEHGGYEKYKELMNDKEYSKGGDPVSNFKLFMGEFAGLDSDKYTDEQIKNMMSELEDSSTSKKLEDSDIDSLAKEVIRGNFGNGQTRKDLLGENYAEVQKRVNELMRNPSLGSKKVTGSEPKNDKVTKALENIGSMGYNITDVLEKYKKK